MSTRKSARWPTAEISPPSRRSEMTLWRTLCAADIAMIGAGGIGCVTAQGVLRSGCRSLTIIEKELVERSNLSRQLFFAADIGKWKAFSLAENLKAHATTPTRIIAIAWPFEKVIEQLNLSVSVAIFGVDNDLCRLVGAAWARQLGIPAVFTMLSEDGMRCHSFLQGPNPTDACLHCAVPTLNRGTEMFCAAAVIESCYLAATYTLFFCHKALMGWGKIKPFNWREADLLAQTPERTGFVKQRSQCPTCSPFRHTGATGKER